jgi:acyl-CoA synthetase (AMP-forming)/AMP-acid ligase II
MDYEPTMAAAVRRAAVRFGDREFIVMPDRRMTYRQAEASSRRVARQLLAAGVVKGTRVGFMLPYGADWVVAWLAITRIGALCMPFSTSYKPPELRAALRHGDTSVLLVPSTLFGDDCHAFLEEVIPGLSEVGDGPLLIDTVPFLRSIYVCGDVERPWARPLNLDFRDDLVCGKLVSETLLEAVEAEVTPADAMMTIFTSGATSEPKAVVHTHGNFLRHGANMASFEDQTCDTRTFCAMPFFWIGGVGLVLNMALAVGSTVLCIERFEADAVLDLMETEHATFFDGWSWHAARLRDHITATGRDLSRIPALAPRGNEDPDLQHNQLGMTETVGPHSTPGPEARRVLPEELRGSFGLQVPFVEHRIADLDSNATLDDGQEGEICVRGYSLMHGLYKRERHEILDDDGWYHTGDVGYLREGCVFYRGRISDVIKTSGTNVTPREVQSTFEAFPEVSFALVTGLPDAARGEVVAAALVLKPGIEIDPAHLMERADKELSSYKLPRKLLVLDADEVPFLPTGKPDPARIRSLLEAHGRPVGPR